MNATTTVATPHHDVVLREAIDALIAAIPGTTIELTSTGEVSTNHIYAMRATITLPDGATLTSCIDGGWDGYDALDPYGDADDLVQLCDAVLEAAEAAFAAKQNAVLDHFAADIAAAAVAPAPQPTVGGCDDCPDRDPNYGVLDADDRDAVWAAHTCATAPELTTEQREAAIDAVKRTYGVSKPVAATVVDEARYDHPALAEVEDADEPDEVAVLVAAATGPIDAHNVAIVTEMLCRRRLTSKVNGGKVRFALANDGRTVLTLDERDWSTAIAHNPYVGDKQVETSMATYGGANPVKVARKVLTLAKMAPRQHCDACEELLTADTAEQGSDDLTRPWCGSCCLSTAVYQCERCHVACSSDEHPYIDGRKVYLCGDCAGPDAD